MNLTPEQVGEIVTVVVGLLIALTNYLSHLSTVSKVATLQDKVNDVHAMVTAAQTPTFTVGTSSAGGINLQPNTVPSSTGTPPADLTFIPPKDVPPRG